MLFVAYCVDKENSVDLRMGTRPAHVDFLKTKGTALKIAGPTTADDGETPNGSMIIFEDASIDAARAWIATDPYGDAGLFASVTVKPWKHAIGDGV